MNTERHEFYDKYDDDQESIIDSVTWPEIIGMALAICIFFVMWAAMWVKGKIKKATP